MKKHLAVFALLVCCTASMMSQDTKKEISLILGAGAGGIKNDNIKSDAYATSAGNSVSPNLGLNFAYYFTKHIGLNIGLEYNQFKSTTYYKAVYRSDQTFTDPDGYLYYKQVEANYTDKRTLNTLDVPLALRVQSYNENFQAFADLGMKFNIGINSKFTEVGESSNKGVYPIKNAPPGVYDLIENLAYYGYTTTKYNFTHDLGNKSLNYSLYVGAGVKVKLQKNAFLLVNPAYLLGLSDIISSDRQTDYTTIAGDKLPYQKFTISQLSLRVGICFAL